MLLPTTYSTALLLTILSLICWGSWANTFKLTKKWRFELFYFDFSIGVLIAAVVAALTLGSMGDDLSFTDNLMIAGRRQMSYAMAAGLVFNLANMLFLASISLVGLSVAFPAGMGLALIVGAVLSSIISPHQNAVILLSGAALVLVAILVNIFAYRAQSEEDGEVTDEFNVKGLVLALVSGILMGSFYPLIDISRAPDVGLGPYSVAFFFALGVFFSTFIYNLYFMNLPVEGEPVGFGQYFRDGSFRSHLLGVAGGVLWCTGLIASLAASGAVTPVSPSFSYAAAQGGIVLSTLWGLLAWREFAGAEMRVKLLLSIMVVLLAAGIGLAALAQGS